MSWRDHWTRWRITGPDPRTASRRAFLGGAATMLTLPFLESMMPTASANTGGPPLRLMFWYVPNGMRMENWTPVDVGPAWTPTPLLTPIDPHRSKVLVLSNLTQLPGADNVAGDHARGTAAFLTARRAARPGEPLTLGESVDYVAAQSAYADGTLFRSFHLATTVQPTSGECDSGYSCAYQNSITWSGPDAPVPPRTDPRSAFDALFLGSNPLLSQAEAQRRHRRRESVLDYVRDEANSLHTRLSTQDQAKLDQYLTGVRELELRLEANPPNGGTSVCNPGQAPGDYADFAEQLDLLTDVMVKAVECDASRVVTMMSDLSGSYRSFPDIGVPEGHHEMSHWATGTAVEQEHRKDQWERICLWHVERFATLLSRLDAVVESDGTTLLDNSLIYFSSEISDGNAHNHDDMPILLAGGGCGLVNTGSHVSYATPQPAANLFLGMLNAFGNPQTSFGDDGTTILPDVFV